MLYDFFIPIRPSNMLLILPLPSLYSAVVEKWFSFGAQLTYVRLYEHDCKFIHKENSTTSLEAELITGVIHWVLTCYYYARSWIKTRTGGILYLHFPSQLWNMETNNYLTWWPMETFALIGWAKFSLVVKVNLSYSIYHHYLYG